MTWTAGAQLQHVDRILYRLTEHRQGSEDPSEIIRTTASIDHWLDQRLVIARRIQRDRAVPDETAKERPDRCARSCRSDRQDAARHDE